MARAAVFALSSAWEGLGNVIIQALAVGCPVVSTDCPSGPAEVLQGGIYGKLVPVADDKALAEAIVATLDEPPSRERLRARAWCFSIDHAAQQYLTALLGERDAAHGEPRGTQASLLRKLRAGGRRRQVAPSTNVE